MSREIVKDCNQLIDFFKEYKFDSQLSNSFFNSHLRSMHKKVFGYLTLVAELEYQNSNQRFISDRSLEYLKESGSDMMQSLFCWFNGTYKPAEMLLRSSIETYLKAILGDTDDGVFNEKSMYKIFDMAKIHPFFLGGNLEEYFSRIYSNYKLLCLTTHTANVNKLVSVDTLRMLPRFNQKTSKSFSQIFISTIEMFLGVSLVNFHTQVYNMHPKNRLNFIKAIPSSIKSKINNV